jgi:serine/threonine-protein kinase Stk1
MMIVKSAAAEPLVSAPDGDTCGQAADGFLPEARFHLENVLGAGGISEVYAALDLRRVEWGDAEPRVALKRIQPELTANHRANLALVQEYCALRQLIHPGVVRVFDLHREPFGICFSMELLEGSTVHEELIAHPWGLGGEAIRRARQLFDTLAFLHRQGVTHGDVKPGNIFLAPGERLVLIDFNVADVTPKPGFACTGLARGLRENLRLPSYTLPYASPERLRGGLASPADDIFAACCVVYEMAAGVHPFNRRSSLEAMETGTIPERPPGLANRHWAALRRGLSLDSAHRPDAEQLAVDFTENGLLSTWFSHWTGSVNRMLFPNP